MRITIKHRLIIILVVSLLVGGLFSVYLLIYSYHSQMDSLSTKLNQATLLEYNQTITTEKEKLSSTLQAIIYNQQIADYVVDKQRDSLYNFCLPMFIKLKNDFQISHFFIIGADDICFLRMHSPNQFGDKITRFTFLESKRTNTFAWGLDLGKNFFSLRVVHPIYKNNVPVAYIDLSEEMNRFFGIMKAQTKDDYILFVEKQYFTKEGWNESIKNNKDRNQWDEFKNFGVVVKTDANGFYPLNELKIEDIPEEGKILNKSYEMGETLFMVGVLPVFDAAKRKVGGIVYLHDITQTYSKLRSNMAYNLLGFGAILLIFIFLIGALVQRKIIAPIDLAKTVLSDISKGKLNTKFEYNSLDEIGDMLIDLRIMITKLKQVVESISHAGKAISNSTVNLNKQSSKLSLSGTDQASAIDEISVSLEELSASNMQNNNHALETDTIANEVLEEIQAMVKVSEETKNALFNINAKNAIINSIASRIGILAINASIEAARAGVSGRGFAVVASEVRKLADETQVAAAEINNYSIDSTETANELVRVTESLLPKIKQTSYNLKHILNAITEQNLAFEHINQSAGQLSNQARSNENISAEAHEISIQLAELSKELITLISVFEV